MANRSRRARRVAFTLVELLTTIAVIGALVALLLPAVQAAREAARRTRCQNNLRQIGVALHLFHDQRRRFPIGCVECLGPAATRKQLAWSTRLLPWLEQQTLFDQLDLHLPYREAIAQPAAQTRVAAYICPSAGDDSRNPALQLEIRGGPSHYGGVYGERITGPNTPPKGVMLYDVAITLREIVDGASRTLQIAEDSRWSDGEWINGRNVFDQAYQINYPTMFENEIRSEHPGGANGLAADGSVHFLTESIDLPVLGALCTRDGGETHHGW